MSIYQKIANIQDKILNIPKDGKNPHFSNTYATYEQVMEVLHPLLREQDLMVCHSFEMPLNSENPNVGVTTKIVDMAFKDDGVDKYLKQYLETTLYIPMTKNDPQMAGSAITYAKRYSVLAMFGLGTEDDDGNGASKAPTSSPKPATATKPTESTDTAKCPNCGGGMWDNRPKKAAGEFSPASPDFKCRDKACGGVIWPAKDKKIAADGSDYMNSLLN